MKMTFTTYQKIMEIVCAILLLFVVLYTVIKWSSMPNIIPTHFNIRGEIDG